MSGSFIDQVIADAFDGIDEHSQSGAVERALAKLKTHWQKIDPVRQELLRDRAIKFMKDRGLGKARLIDAALQPSAPEAGEGGLAFPREEPWPDPVDIGTILEDIRVLIEDHMVLPDGAADAITLWIALTYVFDSFDVLPSIGLVSPLRRCGKTRFSRSSKRQHIGH